MKKQQIELATDLVGTIDTLLGDHYSELNAQFNESLYASETTPADAISNKVMTDMVVQHLPYVDNMRRAIAENPAAVRWLQSSVIRRHEVGWPFEGSSPQFLIGVERDKKDVNLLLHSLHPKSINKTDDNEEAQVTGELWVARGVPIRHYKVAEAFMLTRRTMPLSPEEQNIAYDGTQYSVGGWGNSIPLVTVTDQRAYRRVVDRLFSGSGRTPQGLLRAHDGYEKLTALTDEMLASFEVLTHIGHLASGFGKSEEVKAAIGSINATRQNSR